MLACIITKWKCPLEWHEETSVSHRPCESHLVWWHERPPILPTGTCLEVRGHPVRRNPHSNLTRPGNSGNQTCNGGPSCPPNTLSNHILIEFQLTCKNLVQFCYSIFLTDVPVIPVKWSAVVTSSVWEHIHEMANLIWEKVEPCACPQEGERSGGVVLRGRSWEGCAQRMEGVSLGPWKKNHLYLLVNAIIPKILKVPITCTIFLVGIFILAILVPCLTELWRTLAQLSCHPNLHTISSAALCTVEEEDLWVDLWTNLWTNLQQANWKATQMVDVKLGITSMPLCDADCLVPFQSNTNLGSPQCLYF